MPKAKAEWNVTNPQTGAGVWKNDITDDSFYALIDAYGWPGTSHYYGPITWANEDIVYNAKSAPFYLTSIGMTSVYRGQLTDGPGQAVGMWSSTADREPGKSYNQAFMFGVSPSGPGTAVNVGYTEITLRGFTLRCLTQ